MLDVIDINHHVVAHLEGQVQLFQLLAGSGVGHLSGIERGHLMADGRAVDLDKNQPQPVGDVFHQRCFAVAGRRNRSSRPCRSVRLV